MNTDPADPVDSAGPVLPVDSGGPIDPAGPADPGSGDVDRRVAARRRSRRGALLDFYEEVGWHLGLPRRKSRAVVPPDRRAASATARATGQSLTDGTLSGPAWREHIRRWLPLAAVLVLLASGASFLDWPGRSRTIPASFRGTWVTRHAGYEGRKLVLTESTVQVIVDGEPTSPPAVVRAAKAHSTYTGQVLRLVIATADGADTLEVTLITPLKLTLRRPPDVVWDRLLDQPVSPPTVPPPMPEASR